MLECGDDGCVQKRSGRFLKDMVYIVLEYALGGLLFDLCHSAGALGEDAGRFFMLQLVDALDCMHN